MSNDKIYDDTRTRVLPWGAASCVLVGPQSGPEIDRLRRISGGISRIGVPIRLILGGLAGLIVSLLLPAFRGDPQIMTAALIGFGVMVLGAGWIALSGRAQRSALGAVEQAEYFMPVAVQGFVRPAVRVPADWVEEEPKLLLRWYGALSAAEQAEAELAGTSQTASNEKLRSHLAEELRRYRDDEQRLWRSLQRRNASDNDG
ncbi:MULTISPECIES: hypothetical protein [unclassified Glutamicibacter]|uniref:hypothetical protein n=1 Tax=Glutamicibacter sp. PS TaxID=3075634 RepID=UPI00284AE808|nr:hypothetical protein [Glutamicibacter sp. PS]MDR4533724.1 hypothetical protein [Glutamicibacter sp. PS]